jgi:hypothetical protein
VKLQRGQAVPFFEVATVEGTRTSYRDVWQRRMLLLVSLHSPGGEALEFAVRLRGRVGGDAEIVVTADEVPGVLRPGVLVADRWGEIFFVAPIDPAAIDVDDLADWVRFVQIQCPECQGEAW